MELLSEPKAVTVLVKDWKKLREETPKPTRLR